MHTLASLLDAQHRIDLLNLVYLLAAVLFIFGLKYLSKVKTARRGNLVSALGMLLAACVTFFHISGGEAISLIWIVIALIIGSAIGAVMAFKVPMTGMPQMVGLLNGFGGLASILVAIGDYSLNFGTLAGQRWDALAAVGLASLIGGVTFTGSIVAFGKLQGTKWAPDQPVQFPGQKLAIGALLLLSLVLTVVLAIFPEAWWAVALISLFALTLGVLLVIGIGGADMPVVIALLNSYSGIAASMAGFVLGNFALIITGALVGASGLILTSIMCKAMNRSLANVLFGGMGSAVGGTSRGGPEGTHREFSVEDAAVIMEAAQTIMVVPGYGMAVAQAQHAVKELADELEAKGKQVRYAIHPVAGRMPGHMNVLLAEAGVEYDALLDLDKSNPQLANTDVALVIGANDVTNPAARHDTASPIYGMPILDVDKARQIFVIKRSMNPGFAGIQNELYFTPNCGMVFGDAKKIVTELVNEIEQI
ncbi:MAG: NAD synthetase [Planctomycetes bacterium]|jgi:NAD(P) transhydrogenase subunit beta|nr:NAD synthetase [Planctomycetota bacterium]